MFTFCLVYRVLAQHKTSTPIVPSHHITSLSLPLPSPVQLPVRHTTKSCPASRLYASDFTPGNRTLLFLLLRVLFFLLLPYLLRYEYSVFTSDDDRTEPFSVYIRPARQFVHIIHSSAGIIPRFPFSPLCLWNNLEEGYRSPHAYGTLFFFSFAGFTGS